MNWKEKIAFNERVLDSLDLPEPENGQDLRQWKSLAEQAAKGKELPLELVGNPFGFMADDEIAVYLQKRFGVRVVEETRYVMRRMR